MGLSSNYLRVARYHPHGGYDSATEMALRKSGSFSTYDMALGTIAAATVTENLKVGGTVKLIHESLSDASSSAGAVDAGVIYRLNDAMPGTWAFRRQYWFCFRSLRMPRSSCPRLVRAGISDSRFRNGY